MATYTGTSGNDTFSGTSGNDKFLVGQGGNDTVSGGGGNDSFVFDASLTAADTINGGDGNDHVSLAGNYIGANALVLAATTLTGVETVTLAGGSSYSLTTNDANVAAGDTLTIRGDALTAADTLTFNGAAESDGKFVVYGGAGNDTVTGGAGADQFKLGTGGEDIAHGGGGNDNFIMGAAFDAADQIDGGAGNDTITLAGAYALTFSATAMTNVETMRLSAGHNYILSFNDANVAAGKTLTVDASALGAANTLSFDGSHETDGKYQVTDGAGNDWLKGGAGNDTFNMTHGGTDTVMGGDGNDTIAFGGNLPYGDSLDGGAGTDTLVLDGDYSTGLGIGANYLTSIENFEFKAGHSYNVLVNGLGITTYAIYTFNASHLGASDSLTIMAASAFEDAYNPDSDHGHLVITGGAGNDTITGSGLNDIIRGGAGDDTLNPEQGPDKLTGGSGHDTFMFDMSGSFGPYFSRITDFDGAEDRIIAPVKPTSFAAPITTAISSHNGFQFNGDLTNDLANLQPSQAILYSVTGGSYAGHLFLVVNTSNTVGYDYLDNFVVDITGATHLSDLTLANLL